MTNFGHEGQEMATKEAVLRATEHPASIESVSRETRKCRPNARKHLVQLVKEGKVVEVRLGNCRVFQRVYYKGEKGGDAGVDQETAALATQGIHPSTQESHSGDE